jgi:hypothetical protein
MQRAKRITPDFYIPSEKDIRIVLVLGRLRRFDPRQLVRRAAAAWFLRAQNRLARTRERKVTSRLETIEDMKRSLAAMSTGPDASFPPYTSAEKSAE